MIRAGWQADLGAVALCDYASSNLFGLDGTTGRAEHANYWSTADAPKVEHYNDRGYRELAKLAAGVIAQSTYPDVAPTPTVDLTLVLNGIAAIQTTLGTIETQVSRPVALTASSFSADAVAALRFSLTSDQIGQLT